MRFIKSKVFYAALILLALLTVFLFLNLTGDPKAPKSEAGEPEVSSPANRPDKIKIMVDTTFQPYIEEIAAQYEKQYGIKVEIASSDHSSLHDNIEKSIVRAYSDVDIILVDVVWTPEFARAGYLEPLRNYVQSDLRDKILPIAYDQRVINNDLYALPELYAFPITIEEKFLYYNAKMLKSVGIYAPPNTWEELISMVQYVKEKGLAKYGLVWGWGQGEALVSDYTWLLNALHGQFKDANGNWIFNQGGGVRALDFMVNSLKGNELSDPSSLTINDVDAINKFAAGDIPFLVSWSYANKLLNHNPDFKMALVPGFKDYQRSSTVTGGGALGITRSSKHKDWAWKFIDLTNTQRHEISVNDYLGSIPVWNDLFDNLELKTKYPNLNLMTEQFGYATNRPSMSSYVEWSKVMQTSLVSALTGNQTPKKALDEAKILLENKEIK